MSLNVHPVAVLLGVIILVTLIVFLAAHFSKDARTRRKRRRNYGKVIPRAKRPVVMLNAKTKDPDSRP